MDVFNFKLSLIGVVVLIKLTATFQRGCTKDRCTNASAPDDYKFDDCEQGNSDTDDLCRPGTYRSLECCCECVSGTAYMAESNNCEYCRPYTECGPNEEIESQGTYISDIKCRCRSLPIPWEECIKINCTVFPPNMTNGIPDSGQPSNTSEPGMNTTWPTNTSEPDMNTTQPSNTSEPDMKTCQPYKSEQCDGTWPTGAIIVIVCLICIIIILIIIICYNKKWCCFKKNVTAENTTPNVGAESADTRTHHNDKIETQV